MTGEPDRIAAVALAEDGPADVTSAVTVPAGLQAEGRLEFRSGGVLAGSAFASAVAGRCDCRVEWRASDGQAVAPGTVVGVIRGPLDRILRAERPMLNLLQRASGIASATRRYVDAVAGTPCRILHTRKTAPGLRSLAAPVRDRSGAVVAAVDVAVHLTVWNASVESVLSRLEAPLRRTATEISTRLGHRPHP